MTEPAAGPARDLAALEALAYSHRGVTPSPRAIWIGRQCVEAVPQLIARVRALEAQVTKQAQQLDDAADAYRTLSHEAAALQARLGRLTEALEDYAAYGPALGAVARAALAPDARGGAS